MDRELAEALGELAGRLDRISGQLETIAEQTAALGRMVADLHGVWCVEIQQERRALPDAPKVAVGPGDRVSWTDPKDASNVAWGGTVEFVGLDRKGTLVAHVDFAGYGRRNLPVDQLIVGILT